MSNTENLTVGVFSNLDVSWEGGGEIWSAEENVTFHTAVHLLFKLLNKRVSCNGFLRDILAWEVNGESLERMIIGNTRCTAKYAVD